MQGNAERAGAITSGRVKVRLAPREIGQRIAAMIAPEVLLQGYRLGVFPMGMEDGSIEWFSPDPRGILPLALEICIVTARRR